MTMRGRFINPTGYRLVKLPSEDDTALYEFTLELKYPLHFACDDGRFFQPDKHEITDMGSIPPFVQAFLPKDRCLLTWIIHDSGYAKGGLYVAYREKQYTFLPMRRHELDNFMLAGMEAEGLDQTRRQLAYRMVRWFGWIAWYQRRHKAAQGATHAKI